MILALLFAGSVFAAAPKLPACDAASPALQAFFEGYSDAYARGDTKALRRYLTPDFRDQLEKAGVAPKRTAHPRKFEARISRAVLRDDVCLVAWSAEEKKKSAAGGEPSWFHLESWQGAWKIAAITAEGPN